MNLKKERKKCRSVTKLASAPAALPLRFGIYENILYGQTFVDT